jgi:hypothetical protein
MGVRPGTNVMCETTFNLADHLRDVRMVLGGG